MRTHSHLHRPPLLLWVVTHLQTPKFKMSHYRLPAGLPAAKQTKPGTDNPNCTRSDENLIGAIDTAREQTASHGRSPVCRQANEASCRADWGCRRPTRNDNIQKAARSMLDKLRRLKSSCGRSEAFSRVHWSDDDELSPEPAYIASCPQITEQFLVVHSLVLGMSTRASKTQPAVRTLPEMLVIGPSITRQTYIVPQLFHCLADNRFTQSRSSATHNSTYEPIPQ